MSFIDSYNPHLLDGVQHVHFIGCGGSGTYPLIQILHSRGLTISGSDVEETKITKAERAMGVTVYLEHDAAHLGDAQLVVYSAAIHDENPELKAARARGIPAVERSVMLGYVSRMYSHSVCVSGTHGKTTTTGMITTMLELAGKDPAADNDHLEYYGTMGRLKMAFQKFALLSRTVVFNMDDRNTVDVVNSIDRPVFSFGINEEARFRAVNIQEYRPGFYEFDVLELGEQFAHIKLGVPGYHNIYNALAMCCCVRPLGLQPADAERAAAEFHGTGRRFEIKGECNGAPVVDDYAHHPTELAATMATAKKMGYKRIIAVHQPFTYSRTKALMDDFAAVLRQADQCVLLPIMGSREVDDGSVKSEDLAAKIPGSIVVDGLESAANWVKQNAREGDLVVCMSCGDLYKACDMMVGKA